MVRCMSALGPHESALGVGSWDDGVEVWGWVLWG